MKEIIRHINSRVDDQKENPFIQWLEDDSIPPKKRLTKWLLGGGFFISGFRDLNSMILGYDEDEAKDDKLKQAINAHTAEDSTHWGWYLNDIKRLGLDEGMTFTESLEFLWGKPIRTQRWATYRICQLAAKSENPILRYCLIESIEAFGHVIFGRLCAVAQQYEKATGVRLEYLGEKHFQKEPGELMNQPDKNETERMMRNIELDPETRKLGLEIARETCDLIENRWKEFYALVTRDDDRSSNPSVPGASSEA